MTLDDCADKTVTFFLEHREWDAAFEVISYVRNPDALVRLCDVAYGEMLAQGRTETLVSWLQKAVELEVTSRVLDLIRAELALREGNHLHARRLAEPLARGDEKQFQARALQITGRAAQVDNDELGAVQSFEAAVASARNIDERREALCSLALLAQARDSFEDVTQTFNEFLSYEARTADDTLRAANVRFASAVTVGDVESALAFAADAAIALEHARDPAIRTSFLNAFSRCLSMQLRYAEALEIASRQLGEAESARLDFVLPHAHVAMALALVGLQRYSDAEDELDVAQRVAVRVHDSHNLLEARNIRAKSALARGRYEAALALTEDDPATELVTRVMRAEATATRGLIQACCGLLREASEAFEHAEQVTSVPEVSALVSSGRAVLEFARGDLANTRSQLRISVSLGVLDPLLFACRACPALGRVVVNQPGMPVQLVAELETTPPSRAMGTPPLTSREEEVLELLGRGRTNAEIADELFIAEVTAKVHVRNIIRKLGVRSRTEAAIAVLRQQR